MTSRVLEENDRKLIETTDADRIKAAKKLPDAVFEAGADPQMFSMGEAVLQDMMKGEFQNPMPSHVRHEAQLTKAIQTMSTTRLYLKRQRCCRCLWKSEAY